MKILTIIGNNTCFYNNILLYLYHIIIIKQNDPINMPEIVGLQDGQRLDRILSPKRNLLYNTLFKACNNQIKIPSVKYISIVV